MSIRTIEAPGVEIKEIDKSAYTPAMTGTRVFVMGYASKGEPYLPMQFTSKSAWQLYYGEPDNEAERYFYNACMEVINQNGVLYSARIPYDNKANGKMVAFKYNVGTRTSIVPTAGEYLTKDPGVRSWVDHDADFEMDALKYALTNKSFREIDNDFTDGLEEDTEIVKFYGRVVDRFNETYNNSLEFKRFSISYLSVDQEKSQSLSARFLSRDEALSYLKDFEAESRPGNYQYIVRKRGENGKLVEPTVADPFKGYNILSDGGDWIAVPLYCNYVKEAVAISSFDANVNTDKTVEGIASFIVDNFGSVLGDDANLEDIDGIKDAAETIKAALNDKSVSDTLDQIVAMLKKVDAGVEEGDEINAFGYLQARKNDLLSATVQFQIPDLYRTGWLSGNCNGTCSCDGCCGGEDTLEVVDQDMLVYTTYSAYEFQICDDGADTEWLFTKTVQELYDDEILKLDDDIVAKPLMEKELWQGYLDKNLSSILKVKRDVFYADKDEMLTDKTNNISSWSEMLRVFKEESGIKFSDIYEKYGVTKERIQDDVPFYRLVDLDQSLQEYITITPSKKPVTMELDKIDEYRTFEDKVPSNTFYIVDKTCGTLKSIPEDTRKGERRQMIGIVPVVTTVANALYAQNFIDLDVEEIENYETVTGAVTKSNESDFENLYIDSNTLLPSDVTRRFCQADRTGEEKASHTAIDTISLEAAQYFLPLHMRPDLTGIDKDHSKKIGVVVYQAYLDASEGNKVSFNVVEAFVGSLDKNAKDPNTGVSQFIDSIINTQSDYIYFFSNCLASQAARQTYDNNVDFLVCKSGPAGMLGFFESETTDTISLNTLYNGIDKCFANVSDLNERDIDLVPDAGLANIAQYLRSIYGTEGAHEYDLEATDNLGNPLIKSWKCDSAKSVEAWKTVLFKYDNFCKNVRKDCMFIADGPRPLVLQGQKKIVRSSKPSNTIDGNILPNVKYVTGINTNYGAGYCNWFYVTDEFTGQEFWCPPSIKACGVYINTDLNFEYWDAPAGLNRGQVQALDVAFSPTIKQAGSFYTKNWNYAINYPNDGIILEGQKTFQTKPTAFDRVNVRRLFLRLERQTYKVAQYFRYEGNTAYTRQRLVDMLDPMFKQAKIGGGIYDYIIVCDEAVNTPEVIDNNELRVKIGIKPVKTAEFIIIDFFAIPTGGSFSEMM